MKSRFGWTVEGVAVDCDMMVMIAIVNSKYKKF
jgi:hypothetical protein